jgi:hypothetical protein
MTVAQSATGARLQDPASGTEVLGHRWQSMNGHHQRANESGLQGLAVALLVVMLAVSTVAFGYKSLQSRSESARMVYVAGTQVHGSLGDIYD